MSIQPLSKQNTLYYIIKSVKLACYIAYAIAKVPLSRLFQKSSYSLKNHLVVDVVRYINQMGFHYVRWIVKALSMESLPVEKHEFGYWIGSPIDLNDPSSLILFHFHSGGYVVGNAKQEMPFMKELLLMLKPRIVRIFSLEYPLAPENVYPSQLNYMIEAYKYLLTVVPSDRIVFIGPSAGGNLVFTGLIQLVKKYPQLGLPKMGIAISPWLDVSKILISPMKEDILIDDTEHGFTLNYCPDVSLRKKDTCSPVFAFDETLQKFAHVPLMLTYGGLERIADQIIEFHGRLEQIGCNVQLDVDPLMFHVYQTAGSKVVGKRGRDGVIRIAQFILQHA